MMSVSKSVQEMNRQVAEKLIEEAEQDPQSIYAGKFVGIVNGQVVAVADNWDQLARRLDQVEPDPAKTFSLEVGRDYTKIQEIWGLR